MKRIYLILLLVFTISSCVKNANEPEGNPNLDRTFHGIVNVRSAQYNENGQNTGTFYASQDIINNLQVSLVNDKGLDIAKTTAINGLAVMDTINISDNSYYFLKATVNSNIFTISQPRLIPTGRMQLYDTLNFTDQVINENVQVCKLLFSYPNPFTSKSTVQFELYESSTILINVLNLKGEVVQQLNNSTLAAGTHSFSWGEALEPGIYFVELQGSKLYSYLNAVKIK